MKKIPIVAIAVVGVLVCGAGVAYLATSKTASAPVSDSAGSVNAPTETAAAPIQYSCSDGKMFTASFEDMSASISLEKGKIVMLTQVSADDENGTQFKSSDGKLTLWVREESAFVEQDGTTTYAACRAL